MKYYSEEETKVLREAFEEEVLRWPQVSRKKMFGCPCYQAKGKLFAFFVTKGIVITQLNQENREKLSKEYQTTSFQAGKRIVKNWMKVPVENTEVLDRIMPFVRKSYETALQV